MNLTMLEPVQALPHLTDNHEINLSHDAELATKFGGTDLDN